MTTITDKLQSNSKLVEQKLGEILHFDVGIGEIQRPSILVDAMRYGTLDGGKRLRPFLVTETAKLFGVTPDQTLNAAAAIELIHCYSLVHDDLPAMDDDDLRRGKPTTHKAYDEATAILAGDGLLTLAFKVLTDHASSNDVSVCLELVRLYADAAGIGGMAGGQMFDLAAENANLTEADILQMQSMKTGALIRCACEAGAVLGNASREDRNSVVRYGLLVGQAFQLTDDILDITSDASAMGKNTGKDADRGKATLVGLLGFDAAKQKVNALVEEAISALEQIGGNTDTLSDLARYIVERDF